MDESEGRLREAGLRVTRPRLAVLAEVAALPHADVQTITRGARRRVGSLSTQAVYDVVHALTDAGLLRCIQPAGSAARYEVATGDDHHHLVCRQCREITDVPCPTGTAARLHPDEHAGYQIDRTEVTYWGLCPRCRTEPQSSTALQTHVADPEDGK